jgi:hypothetical protein
VVSKEAGELKTPGERRIGVRIGSDLMARYQRVRWNHDFADEPVVLWSEITDAGVESRKVDEYRDGRLDYADGSRTTGSTFLSEKTMPGLDEIAQQSEFMPSPITKEEFEDVWRRATGQG